MSVKMWRYFQWFAYVVCVGAQSYRDSRLVVTDYIELGRIEEAKNASKVISRDLYTSVVTSYSGFFRVTHEQNRHLYFWYFPCEYRNETKPLVLWLEGDPGKSSILGVFSGVGPYTLNAAETAVIYNTNTWTKEFNVLFVDSPVGAGFSFSESRSIGSVSSIRDLAKHLLKALRQFYIMFPELRSQPFFIAGRRFAAKYAAALTNEIEDTNTSAANKINLKGLILSNPFVDAYYHMRRAYVLRQFGLLQEAVYRVLMEEESVLMNMINQGSTVAAYHRWSTYQNRLSEVTKLRSFNNALEGHDYDLEHGVRMFINRGSSRVDLHLGNAIFGIHPHQTVLRNNLAGDILTSAKNDLELATYKYGILFLTGNLDLLVPAAKTEEFLNDFYYSGRPVYFEEVNQQWVINEVVHGYKKSAQNITSIVLINCGHLIFADCGYQGREAVVQFVAQYQ